MIRIALITINRAVVTRRYGAILIEIPKISAAMMVPATVIQQPISTRPIDVRSQFSIFFLLLINGTAGSRILLMTNYTAIAISSMPI
jgi:hypothetical protein